MVLQYYYPSAAQLDLHAPRVVIELLCRARVNASSGSEEGDHAVIPAGAIR